VDSVYDPWAMQEIASRDVCPSLKQFPKEICVSARDCGTDQWETLCIHPIGVCAGIQKGYRFFSQTLFEEGVYPG